WTHTRKAENRYPRTRRCAPSGCAAARPAAGARGASRTAPTTTSSGAPVDGCASGTCGRPTPRPPGRRRYTTGRRRAGRERRPGRAAGSGASCWAASGSWNAMSES
ncbi:MAG: hypothetical protein AVDCRST_MAG77-4829, partial [uncultured Chloroflexi bacterium]